MAKKDKEVSPIQFVFNFLVGILSILTVVLLFLLFKDYQGFKESTSHVPTFLPYYILIVLYISINEGFEYLEYDTMVHGTRSPKKTYLIISQIISALLVGIAIYFAFSDFLRLFSNLKINLKNIPEGQLSYSIMISATTLFFIFSSVCLFFSEFIFKTRLLP